MTVDDPSEHPSRPDEPDAPPPAPGRYRRQIFQNTAATALANAWTIILMLISVPVLLSSLGTVTFGVWALLQTFSGVTGWFSLADAGLGYATTRALADRRASDDGPGQREVVGSSLATIAAISSLCALGLAVVGPLVLPRVFDVPASLVADLQLALVPFAIQVGLELVGSHLGCCLDGLQRVDLTRAIDTARRTLVLGGACVVAVLGGGLVQIAVAGAVAVAVCTMAAALVLRRHLGTGRLHATRARAAELLHYGRRVWLLTGTGVLHRTMDRTIVGIILGPSAVALVEVATQIQNGVSAAMSASSFSVISSSAFVRGSGDQHRLRELLVRATRYTCLATLPLSALVALLAPALVDVWVGPAYAEAAGLVALAVAYQATQAPLAPGSNLLLGTGRAGTLARAALASLTVNLVLSVVLVHAIGVAGAFVATIASSLVLVPMLAAAITEETGVSWRQLAGEGVRPSTVPTIAAACVVGAVLLFGLGSWPTLLIGGALGSVAWIGGSWRWGLTTVERRELAQVLGRR